MENPNSIGTVETQYVTFDNLTLCSGKELRKVIVAYETYGKLNASKSNAILIDHAFTGDAHAAGFHKGAEKPGWWDSMIGPGKAFDTNKYFVICSNVLGGCAGTTGPSSINPQNNKRYALDFPFITISDMVVLQKKLTDFLGIEKLLSVAGGSMGGMQVLQWAVSFPEKIRSAIPISTTMKHSPQQIAFNEVARQAIMADADWNDGDYYGKRQPVKGLSVARMMGHITYMSDKSMEDKFSRDLKNRNYSFSFNPDFEVEGYLNYQGSVFVKRFDANSYLYITKAMDYFDVSGNNFLKKDTDNINFLIISFASDWLYLPYQSEEIIRTLALSNCKATYIEIKSSYGHDAFLIEIEDETKLIRHFLSKLYKEVGSA
ncbi:MAG: homoserine O-acetyltransferase [Elusimicrobiota bacterium]|jgi:homoserine O-acetyltransferase|nr:homoserine O-acetyltransferase [Elusimicrobiota bacterium]